MPSKSSGDNESTKATTSRRGFIGAAAMAGTAFVAPVSASEINATPHQGGARSEGQEAVTGSSVADGAGLNMPSTIRAESGAPLGGIGTGFVEIRPDGLFYEWQIFNRGSLAGRSPKADPGAKAAASGSLLRFFLRTAGPEGAAPQVRRLYLSAEQDNLYSLAYAYDIESIDYQARYPVTELRYKDATLPIQLSAKAFSPFIPGNSRDSGTPGFHMVFTARNTSKEPIELSLLGILDNPLLPELPDRQLKNQIRRHDATTALLLDTDAQPKDKAGAGNLCLSVTGGDHSFVSGTFAPYASADLCRWQTKRMHYMLLNVLDDFLQSGRLPNAEVEEDPSKQFTLSDEQIDALSQAQIETWLRRLSEDALLGRVIRDARTSDSHKLGDSESGRALLKEIRQNLAGGVTPGPDRSDPDAVPDPRSSAWGTGALCSTLKLEPGQQTEVRFALSWFFPHHVSNGVDLGHMYANWFGNAAQVNDFLVANYDKHRNRTEAFARTLADTSLGSTMAFVWSSQLSTLLTSTWWTRDGSYAIWEGLGCCGLSTTDVDYTGSFPATALFPDLKLGQMKRIITLQNARGQVPHNYTTDLTADNDFARVDLNPQFVMLTLRDYLWTGDRGYLEYMWPHVVRAMAYTSSLDTDGDGLPDKDTGLQTYDQWSMRGAPAYVGSLWIGALRAAVRIAEDLGKTDDAKHWKAVLDKASESFDRVLFNGDYYSLWVDGAARSEICMADQVSGEWFTHLIGLPGSLSEKNVAAALDSICRHNLKPDLGLRNASAPKGGKDLLAMTSLQAGGVWSGIEFAFASFLMGYGRYADGERIVTAVHRRYLRAGLPWNHMECGNHYARAMSSWTTLLAATGFKPDVPAQSLALVPSVPGDFHAPWAAPSGFGRVSRRGSTLAISCRAGSLSFKTLKVNLPGAKLGARLAGRALVSRNSRQGVVTTMEFAEPVAINAGQALMVG